MLRIEGSIHKNGRILRSCVSRQAGNGNRTEKVLLSLKEICEYLDLPVPIWLEKNIYEFKNRSSASFQQDSFIEEINFDYLKIEVIEE